MNLTLNGKRAVVCGSTQGIGKAIAVELALLGASCTLIARNENKLRQAIGELAANAGQEHEYLVADFSKISEVQALIDGSLKNRTVHILINNTGGPAAGPIVDATAEQFLAAFQQHLVVNHLLTNAVIPSMRNAEYGRIINIVSTSVKIPIRNLGVSNTVRGAVASWAKTMANELGRWQITVNNLLPGNITTSRLDSLITTTAQHTNVSTAEVEAAMKKDIPLGRFGTPGEIAALAAFLAAPAGAYISGTSIPVDGGKTGSI
ncbi:MAG TPA: SDR family oxidoreductase [Chitinophagaceae bacterium]